MKHIKPYKIFENKSPNFPTTRKKVIEVCKKYEINNYTINDDLSIDVDDFVDLSQTGLEYIPLRFNYVSGGFRCSQNELKSLEGCPQTVGGGFYCFNNKLETLKGCPQTVNSNFYCSNNKLESLEGCPQTVNGGFYCFNNKLETLKGCPQTVNGDFLCYRNELVSLKGCPQTVDGDFNCSKNELETLEGSPQKVGGYFNCRGNELVSLIGCPQTVDGDFDCSYNKLKDLEHFPEVSGDIDIRYNTVYLLLYTFIKNADSFLIEDFIDYEIVRNRDTVMLDRLQTFIRDNDLEMPYLEDIKEHYKIIE
jgi:hypothetical protein